MHVRETFLRLQVYAELKGGALHLPQQADGLALLDGIIAARTTIALSAVCTVRSPELARVALFTAYRGLSHGLAPGLAGKARGSAVPVGVLAVVTRQTRLLRKRHVAVPAPWAHTAIKGAFFRRKCAWDAVKACGGTVDTLVLSWRAVAARCLASVGLRKTRRAQFAKASTASGDRGGPLSSRARKAGAAAAAPLVEANPTGGAWRALVRRTDAGERVCRAGFAAEVRADAEAARNARLTPCLAALCLLVSRRTGCAQTDAGISAEETCRAPCAATAGLAKVGCLPAKGAFLAARTTLLGPGGIARRALLADRGTGCTCVQVLRAQITVVLLRVLLFCSTSTRQTWTPHRHVVRVIKISVAFESGALLDPIFGVLPFRTLRALCLPACRYPPRRAIGAHFISVHKFASVAHLVAASAGGQGSRCSRFRGSLGPAKFAERLARPVLVHVGRATDARFVRVRGAASRRLSCVVGPLSRLARHASCRRVCTLNGRIEPWFARRA